MKNKAIEPGLAHRAEDLARCRSLINAGRLTDALHYLYSQAFARGYKRGITESFAALIKTKGVKK